MRVAADASIRFNREHPRAHRHRCPFDGVCVANHFPELN
jgi:hypothetical protein